MISPAGADLGLGDQLTEQMTAAEMEARRKRQQQQSEAQQQGKAPVTPAIADLFGGTLSGL
jgi:hypothetical protein